MKTGMRPALQRERDEEGPERRKVVSAAAVAAALLGRTENARAAAGARFGRTEAQKGGQHCSGSDSATWKDQREHDLEQNRSAEMGAPL